MSTAKEVVDMLQLQPHPEGGYFREMYRSGEFISGDSLPIQFGDGSRSISTAIYFMLEKGNFSAFHRIKSDEVWHHYEGAAVEVVVIHADGRSEVLSLGKDYAKGQRPLQVVPAGCWFASRVTDCGFALVGCTVAPGFCFDDFELADRDELIACYPQHRSLIVELTR